MEQVLLFKHARVIQGFRNASSRRKKEYKYAPEESVKHEASDDAVNSKFRSRAAKSTRES